MVAVRDFSGAVGGATTISADSVLVLPVAVKAAAQSTAGRVVVRVAGDTDGRIFNEGAGGGSQISVELQVVQQTNFQYGAAAGGGEATEF